ncbi:MAG TPA: hypothetical protein VNA65_05865 [Candidatus Dormibacteraeota bacterium]|nr:hypothetical protein [Candidatus Dormibacteraeota bacterium]
MLGDVDGDGDGVGLGEGRVAELARALLDVVIVGVAIAAGETLAK